MERHHVISAAVLFALAGLHGWPTAATAEVRYTVTDLSAIWEASFSEPGRVERWFASAINNHGQIAGHAETTDNSAFALVWDEASGLRDLSDFEGASWANAINNLGQAAIGGSTAAMWDPDAGLREIAGTVDPNGINDLGQVVGMFYPDLNLPHAFLWEDGVMHDLGNLGADGAVAYSVNNMEQVVGWSETTDGSEHAYLWDSASGMRDLGTMGLSAYAMDINKSGEVVGYGGVANGHSRAFVWQDDVLVNIDSLAGEWSQAAAINNASQIVGSYGLPGYSSTSAFFWESTHGMRDINDLLDEEPEWQILGAVNINDQGWIIATGRQGDGPSDRVVLLTPVPEPTSLVFVLCAVTTSVVCFRVLNRIRRRRQ